MPRSSVVTFPHPEPLEPFFVTPLEASRLLSLSRSEVYKLLDDSVIESVRHGTRRMVVLESLKRFAATLPREA